MEILSLLSDGLWLAVQPLNVAMRIILPKGLTEPLFLPIYELVF